MEGSEQNTKNWSRLLLLLLFAGLAVSLQLIIACHIREFTYDVHPRSNHWWETTVPLMTDDQFRRRFRMKKETFVHCEKRFIKQSKSKITAAKISELTEEYLVIERLAMR